MRGDRCHCIGKNHRGIDLFEEQRNSGMFRVRREKAEDCKGLGVTWIDKMGWRRSRK